MFTRIEGISHRELHWKNINQTRSLTFKVHVRYVEAHVGQESAEAQQKEGWGCEEAHVEHGGQSPPHCLGTESALMGLLLKHIVEGGQVSHRHRILQPAVLSGGIQKETTLRQKETMLTKIELFLCIVSSGL